MKDALPINSHVLEWARTSIGMSIEEVAYKLKKSREAIIDWEKGDSTPTYSQLEKLAYQIYKRPIAVFFFPEIPQEDTPNTEFRTLPDTLLEELPTEIIKLYRKAKVFQMNLAELFDDLKPVSPSLIDNHSLSKDADVVSLAKEMRDELGYSIDEQYSWNSPDKAFKMWREAFEKSGVYVFKDAFRNNDYSGFCIYDKKYPIIYVNNSMAHNRQIFTLFHELAHLLFHAGGIDFRDSRILESSDLEYLNIERICSEFAGEFLVPSKEFEKYITNVSEENISELANLFSVSREVILRKYKDFRKVDSHYYNELVSKWIREKIKTKSGHGDYYRNQIVYLGNSYIELAFSRYYKNQITAEGLANYLKIRESHISTIEHYAFGV